MNSKKLLVSIFCCFVPTATHILCAATITGPLDDPGSLKKWHKVEITFDGPHANETNASTFTDNRLDVTLTRPGGSSFTVPGFFAADGDAADSGAGSGNKWRVRLCPDEVGRWHYQVSFRTGSGVAYPTSPSGTAWAPLHGTMGLFDVGPSDKDPSGRDHRGKGMLFYVGKHHTQFGESGEYWIMGGPGSPEDIMGFEEFDNTGGHNWNGHSGDYDASDAAAYTWKGGKGKNLLGAIKYASDEGMNSLYIILLTAPQGDTKTSFPWVSTASEDRQKYDVSKLEQWERVFSYMDKKGINLHLFFSETENDSMICGNFGTCNELKLYYRELVARFSHHHGVLWDIGEEYDGSCNDIKSKADYIRAIDPYNHPITCHTHSDRVSNRYSCLFGHPTIEATSNQHNCDNVKANTQYCRDNSAAAGRPYCVYSTETRDPLCRCSGTNNMNDARRLALWGNLMGGGAGIEWYFGYASGGWNDINCNDWHIAHCVWDDTKHALDFFMARGQPDRRPVPFQNMSNADGRVTGTGNWCLYGRDDDGKPCLVIYMDNGGSTSVNAPAAQKYKVGWMNAKTGAWQYRSDVNNHRGGNINFTAPSADEWALLLYDWSAEKDPPTPDPAQWDTVPTATSEREIAMMAVEGMDAQTPPVEYYFEELSGNCHGDDSGWQTEPIYVDANLAPGTQYTYRVKMRDQAGNEAAWSPQASATTLGVSDPDPPSPDPAEFNEPPHNTGEQAIRMSAVEGTDLNGPVEYYFEETSGNPGGSSSGWQTDPTYTDTDLQAATQYSYTVKMRDAVCNESRPSDTTIACTRPDTVDIVADARINGLDLEKMLSHWLEDNCCTADLCEYSDLDANGRIGFGDYAILAENWLAVLGPQTIELTFRPIDDAYLQNSTGYNNQQLKVQPSGPARIVYLKFDVAGIPYGYDVTNVEVMLTENGDTGNGTLRFYRGSHNDWAEETISAGNAPDVEDQVGSRSGSVGDNQTITVDIKPLVTGNGIFTVIIKMDAGGNDIWFGSKESPKVPNLIVTARRKD